VLYIPIGIWILTSHQVTAAALGRAASAGILCSAVPMVADWVAIGTIVTANAVSVRAAGRSGR